jgi:hypothetical protein
MKEIPVFFHIEENIYSGVKEIPTSITEELKKQLWVRLTQQFFFSSSGVIATTCFDHMADSGVLSQAVCLTAIAVSWISNHELWKRKRRIVALDGPIIALLIIHTQQEATSQ